MSKRMAVAVAGCIPPVSIRSSGTPCIDFPVDPIVQFDASGRFLKSFGQGDGKAIQTPLPPLWVPSVF